MQPMNRMGDRARGCGCILLWLAAPLAWGGAGAASGVHGSVVLSPSCAGAQVDGAECQTPFADVVLQLSTLEGQLVSSGRSSVLGLYDLAAPAGRYRLQVIVPMKIVRCPRTEVEVIDGQSTPVAVRCDSGMR